MINKESIKEIILNGGTVKFPYKENVEEWFGEVYIHIYKQRFEDVPIKNEVVIGNFGLKYPIGKIDEAINKFYDIVFGNTNIAFAFNQAMVNLELYDYDGEDELTELIEKEIIKIRTKNN